MDQNIVTISRPAFISRAALICLATAVLAWLISFLPVYQVLSGYCYDLITISIPKPFSVPEAKVLLIHMDKEYPEVNDDDWLQLLKELEELKASLIIFSFLPGNAGESFFSAAKSFGNVFFARAAKNNPETNEWQFVEKIPAKAENLGLSIGVLALPDSMYGIYRTQQYNYAVNGKPYPAVETLAAQAFLKNKQIVSGKDYFIYFSYQTLPFLNLKQILKGELVPELIKNKVVFIGKDQKQEGMATPLVRLGEQISTFQYHGLALNTLLTEQAIRWCTGFAKLGFILISNFLVLAVFYWSSLRFVFLILAGILLAEFVIAWLVLALFYLWIPILAMWIAHILFFIFYMHYQDIVEHDQIWKIIHSLSGKFLRQNIPDKVYAQEQYWSKIIVMVSQSLNLERAIFLESKTNSYYVQEVIALNCGLADIHERRRDYRREPYRSAIKQNAILPVEQFFLYGTEDEQQFIYPLTFLDRLLGFWVFSIKPKQSLSAKQEDYIRRVGRHIATLLFYRDLWLKQKKEKNFFNYFQHTSHYRLLATLDRMLSLLERQFTAIEDYLNAQSTASIFFDLFGRIWIANQKMQALLKRANIRIEELTALDMLHQLAGVEIKEAKRLLQTLIVEGGEAAFTVNLPNINEKIFKLRLAAINTNIEDYRLRTKNMLDVERQGFLCEIIDLSLLRQEINRKQ